ncbi:MAG: YggS family pyridoxal phosphate-dependent enzyme [Firmicutes bacterium]|nr:YggS family pyridoxal phosphate-dependent enzyme [Clostridiales bacterium]MBQ9930967.1 YggS family pyridoxal phosphate-dependent enzyme [Bacillota bacterium]
MGIKENIQSIEARKEAAAREFAPEQEALLVAVTKTRTPEEINEAIRAGVTDIGENKVQEIMAKYDQIDPVRWHLIGHLQTNKVKYIIDKVDLIHSVDSLKLAAEIDRRAAQHGKVMDILIQVNTANEESKSGVSSGEAEELFLGILENCPNIRVCGIMCMAPVAEDPEDVRPFFHEARELYDKFSQVKHERAAFRWLSMGMSHDFEAALKEGANLIRVGSAIFGERDYGNI